MLAESLAIRYGTRNNGAAMLAIRHDPVATQQSLGSAGLRAVRQTVCVTEEQVRGMHLLPAAVPLIHCLEKEIL